MINFHLAELIQRISSPHRKEVLQKAREAYESFLNLLENYQMLSPADKKLHHTYSESPTTFSTISSSDPAARRDTKIANFKVEKELKNKLHVGYAISYRPFKGW